MFFFGAVFSGAAFFGAAFFGSTCGGAACAGGVVLRWCFFEFYLLGRAACLAGGSWAIAHVQLSSREMVRSSRELYRIMLRLQSSWVEYGSEIGAARGRVTLAADSTLNVSRF